MPVGYVSGLSFGVDRAPEDNIYAEEIGDGAAVYKTFVGGRGSWEDEGENDPEDNPPDPVSHSNLAFCHITGWRRLGRCELS